MTVDFDPQTTYDQLVVVHRAMLVSLERFTRDGDGWRVDDDEALELLSGSATIINNVTTELAAALSNM